jgi:hypothetical protein
LAVAEVAKLNVNDALRNTIPALIGSAVDADLLKITSEKIQPLTSSVATMDLLTNTTGTIKIAEEAMRAVGSLEIGGTIAGVLQHITSIELKAALYDVSETVASLAAKSLPLPSVDQLAPVIDIARELQLGGSALMAIQPLQESLTKYNAAWSATSNLFSPRLNDAFIDSIGRIKDAQESLFSSAIRFDSLSPLEGALKVSGDLQSGSLFPLYELENIINDQLRIEMFSSEHWTSAIGASQVVPALESVISLSLQPSISELVAQRLDLDIGSPILQYEGLHNRLAYEAKRSFVLSRELGGVASEQLALLTASTNLLSHDLTTQASKVLQQFDETNQNLSSLITGLEIQQNLPLPTFGFPQMRPVTNLAEIARTYEGYLADTVRRVNIGDWGWNGDIGIVTPTRVVTSYVDSIYGNPYGMEGSNAPFRQNDLLLTTGQESEDVLSKKLAVLGPNFIAMWQGCRIVLDSNSPDKIRQSAHSGRELLMQVLTCLAPTSAFEKIELQQYGHNNQPTRQMRVKMIMKDRGKRATAWVDAVAKAIDETYDLLAATSHNRKTVSPMTDYQAASILYTLGGLLIFILSDIED